MSQDDASEWKTITKNSKRCAGKRNRHHHAKVNNDRSYLSSSSLTLNEMTKSLQSCMEELKKSQFFGNFEKAMIDVLLKHHISTIVCYGVGNFGKSKLSAPMWQLAFAMAAKEFLQNQQQETHEEHSSNIVIHYFEPNMTNEEAIFLERNSIQIIPDNERGKRKAKGATFFFMPHCPLLLYSNLLHTNWENANNLIIFGNSLSAYTNRLISEETSGVELLRLLEPHWEEMVFSLGKEDISNLPAYFEQAFNDSSLTYFPEKNQENELWPEMPESLGYEDDDGGETI